MQDELENKDNYYCSVPHKEWYDHMSTMDTKDNRKQAEFQIKILASSQASTANYDSDAPARIPRKNK